MKKTILLALIGICSIVTVALGQSSFDMSPGAETGEKVLGSYFSTDIDTVSMSNGNLHLSIPLINLSGREVPLRLSMDYNSKFFEQRTYGLSVTYDFLGWRKDTGLGGILSGTQTAPDAQGHVNVTIYWIEWNGTKHQFTKNGVTSISNLTIDSTASDGLRLETGTYFQSPTAWGTATITFKNGTRLLLSQRHVVVNLPDGGDGSYNEYQWEMRTLTGNSLIASYGTETDGPNGTGLHDGLPLGDTVGRSVTYSKTSTAETITIRDSNNQLKTYTINWASVPARSPDDSLNLTIKVVQSIGLPNGRSYQFTYNPQGYLDRVTFPSGAYIRYTYGRPDSFGWIVASRRVSADGTAASEKVWTYDYTYNGAIDHTTVTDPAGGKTVHYFDGNGQETKTEFQTSTGTLLKQVVRTFQSGPLGNRLVSESTTQGSFNFKSDYGYDNWNNRIGQYDYEYSICDCFWGAAIKFRGEIQQTTSSTPRKVKPKLHTEFTEHSQQAIPEAPAS